MLDKIRDTIQIIKDVLILLLFLPFLIFFTIHYLRQNNNSGG